MQTIHMKCQVLFSQKNKTIYFKVLSVAVVISFLRVIMLTLYCLFENVNGYLRLTYFKITVELGFHSFDDSLDVLPFVITKTCLFKIY